MSWESDKRESALWDLIIIQLSRPPKQATTVQRLTSETTTRTNVRMFLQLCPAIKTNFNTQSWPIKSHQIQKQRCSCSTRTSTSITMCPRVKSRFPAWTTPRRRALQTLVSCNSCDKIKLRPKSLGLTQLPATTPTNAPPTSSDMCKPTPPCPAYFEYVLLPILTMVVRNVSCPAISYYSNYYQPSAAVSWSENSIKIRLMYWDEYRCISIGNYSGHWDTDTQTTFQTSNHTNEYLYDYTNAVFVIRKTLAREGH
jgi:hypothetical protein